jgi:signal transduction histidine kinase
MPVHPLPPEPGPGEPPGTSEGEAVREAWSEAFRADARAGAFLGDLQAARRELKERDQQAAMMRHVANILTAATRMDQLGTLILDVFQSEFGARQGLMWALAGGHYAACHGMGLDSRQLAQLRLPAPHPFPHYPILIYQAQWLETESLPPGPKLVQARPDDGLFLVPFEHQTLLVGFAVLSLPKLRSFSSSELDSLEVLQRLFAASLYSLWMLQDLERQRDEARDQARRADARVLAVERQNQALQEGQTFRVDFVAYAAGELRRQLFGVLGVLNRVRTDQGLRAEDRASLLLDGLLTGKHMAGLLRDLGELARPMREGAPEVRPVDLAALLGATVPLVEALASAGSGTIDWPSELDLPEVLADGEVLRQILLALCSGAVRNSRDGSLHLWVEREPLSLQLKLMVEELDLGAGTDRFNAQHPLRPEELYASRSGGACLGLLVCRQLIAAMGGTFTLERDPMGRGTVIGVGLPLA